MGLQPEIIVANHPGELAERGARIFVQTAKDCVAQKEFFSVAISGGSTPRPMHRVLAKEPYRSEVPWKKTHIFWVDERCVPLDHPASNYGQAREDFLDRIPIPSEQVHAMPGDVSPEKGARSYQEEMQRFFQGTQGALPAFDLVFLGVGKDGHTASLFPGIWGAGASEKWVLAVKGGVPDVYRLTLTYEVLNGARKICFLVSGQEKAPIVKAILEGGGGDLPASRIRPPHGKWLWLLDKEAASLLFL